VVAALGARALTVGDEIWLGPGEAAADGRLIAHELAHVEQQRTNPRSPTVQLEEADERPVHAPFSQFDPRRLTGRFTTCVVSHHRPSGAVREPEPPASPRDELRRFVAAGPSPSPPPRGTPFPPPPKPRAAGPALDVTVTQDLGFPSPDGKPRTAYDLEFSRPVTPVQARQSVFGEAPAIVTGLAPRARLIDQGAPRGAHRVYSLYLTDESAPFVQPAIAERLRATLAAKAALLPPLEQQIPKWLPEEGRRAILGGKLRWGVSRFGTKGPWGTAFVWHGHDDFGREVYEVYEEWPENPDYYLKHTGGDTHEARVLAKVHARFNRDMRWLLVGEADEQPRGLPPLAGALSPSAARQRLIELYGEEFKLVIEAFVGVLGAGVGITSIGGGLRQRVLAGEKQQMLSQAEALLERPDPVNQRLRGLQRAWREYQGPKSLAEWRKTEAPRELHGVSDAPSGFASSRLEEFEVALRRAEEVGTASPPRVRAYRVQGGTPPKNISHERVTEGAGGEIKIVPEPGKSHQTKLYITFEDPGRARVYLRDNRPGGRIVSFEVERSFVEEIRAKAVRQAEIRGRRGFPEISDPSKTSAAAREALGLAPHESTSYGLPAPWIEKLEKAAIPKTLRIE
jgi:hypothetical protein